MLSLRSYSAYRSCFRPSSTLRLRKSIMASADSLQDEMAKQKALFNDLRTQNADAALLEEAKKKLGDLQKAFGLAKAGSGPKDGSGKKKERILLKTAKGTRDYGPAEMFAREHVERIVKDCFTTFGGSCLDTPVFERKEILAGKYGEEGGKLIFDLMDQGGEQLSLRYDHTVPLARYLAMIGGTTTQSKIWQVGKVYRRDQPVMSKGRMREFMQADFDYCGAWDPMIPDSEIISLVCTILKRLDVGEFTVKINHRKILDGIFEVCGVPQDKIRTISSAVDKLDKTPWAEVKKEMTEEKGLDPAVADKIGEYVKLKGGSELLDQLSSDAKLSANPSAKAGLADMSILFRLLASFKVVQHVSFDMSLARGLDYYTGIIYEAIVAASAPPGFDADAFAATAGSESPAASKLASADAAAAQAPKKKAVKKAQQGDEDDEEVDESSVGVGSIGGGGRYDNLVGMFSAAAAGEGKKAGASIPCVGVSIGLDRIFALVWKKWEERGVRSKETMAYVMAAGDGLLDERVGLVQELRENGIKCDFLAKTKPKLPAQFAAGERDEVPFAIILGESELKEGLVTVKAQKWKMESGKKVKVESADKGVKVKRAELVEWLKGSDEFREWEGMRLAMPGA